jgi:hypothetical protein
MLVAIVPPETSFTPPSFPLLPIGLSAEGLDKTLLNYLLQESRRRREQESQNRLLLELHRVSLSLIGEMRLDKLIFKVLRIALENSHAEEASCFCLIPKIPTTYVWLPRLKPTCTRLPPSKTSPLPAWRPSSGRLFSIAYRLGRISSFPIYRKTLFGVGIQTSCACLCAW